jgi:hypothetical protein
MKYLCALACVVIITSPFAPASANDTPQPQHKPPHKNITADPEALSEAKFLLEQISLELQKAPPPPSPAHKNARQATRQQHPSSATSPAPVAVNTQPQQQPKALLISREGDIDMSCGPLSHEALRMRDIIYKTQEVKDRAKMQNHGIAAAGAIGSFLIGSVTGGVGLAVGGFLLDQNFDKIEEDADNIQDIAAQRRTLMMGIYNAKGCEGPLEHAMQNPEIFDPLAKIAAIAPAHGEEETGRYND